MNGSEGFQETIKTYLQGLSLIDKLFAETFKKENKNISDCATYICTEVQKSGQCGFSDDEVYKMAVHYYDEDKILIENKEGGGRVVINHHIPFVKTQINHSKVYNPKSHKVQPVAQTSLF